MVFVTLGTSDYPFTRLLKKLDELVEKNKIKNIKVIIIIIKLEYFFIIKYMI